MEEHVDLIVGNKLSTSESIVFTSSIALLVSAMVAPFSAILPSNISCGFAPLALNAEKVLLKNLSNCELLNSILRPLVTAALIPLPTP